MELLSRGQSRGSIGRVQRALLVVTAATTLGALAPGVASASGQGALTQVPAQAPSADVGEGVTAVAVGDGSSCVVAGGDLACWGSNTDGELGDGTVRHSTVPVPVATAGTPLAGADIAEVAVGDGMACARTSGAAVACWGEGVFVRVGSASVTKSRVPIAIDTTGILAGRTVTQISIMRVHTCVVASGTAACWGYNGDGRVGDGSTTARSTPVAVTTAGTPLEGKTIARIDAGYASTCAVATDGTLACWGANESGELGNGTTTSSTVPVAVTTAGTPLEGKTVVDVTVGHSHACARTSDGLVACWGSGATGALGQGSTASSTVPVAVATTTALQGRAVQAIEAGSGTTCARASGAAVCWGANGAGQLGSGTVAYATRPQLVSTTGSALEGRPITVMGTGLAHSCAAAGTVLACWGNNRYGATGNARSAVSMVPAARVAGVLDGASVAQIDGGQNNGCAQTTAGAVACWGDGAYNQVGVLGVADQRVPVWVNATGSPLATSPAVDLAVGGIHACAASANGGVTCWGSNGSKQLGRAGLGSNPAAVTTAGSAIEGKTVVEVVAGAAQTCVRTSDGIVACWGAGQAGQLGAGPGALTSTSVPTAIITAGTPLAGKAVTDLAYGDGVGCALTADSTLACWGDNTFGSVGDGTKVDRSVPTAVTKAGTPLAGKTIVAVEGGETGTMCAVTSDGASACWGENGYGSTGSGSKSEALVPVATATTGTVLAGRSIVQASPGYIHACFRTTDSTLACAGNAGAGSLGDDGDTADELTPVPVVTAGTPLAGKAIKQLTSIGYAQCALTTDSIISCWGLNDSGQLGNGVPSFEVRPQTVVGFEPPAAVVPGVPIIGAAVAGDGQATVTWTAPVSDGGSAITGYVVTPYVGAVAQPSIASSGTGTSKVVTGLVNGTSYSFKVAAVNAIGTGSLSAASNVVTPVAPIPGYAPFGSWGALVDRLFVDLTAAKPTSAERSSWVAQLSAGSKTKGDLVVALRLTTDNTSRVDPTVRLYRALLGRAPDAGGLKFWITRRRSGNWTLNRMATSFSDSSEFKRKYGSLSNRAFVTQIYTDVLGRPADASGVNYWTNKLDTKQRTRGTVMVGFSESNEYKRKQAENTDVAVAYIFLLGRVPTTGETSGWTSRQKAGTAHAVLAQELLDSAAYATHISGS